MVKGRQPLPGTLEARKWIQDGNLDKVLSQQTELSQEAKNRILQILKAILKT